MIKNMKKTSTSTRNNLTEIVKKTAVESRTALKEHVVHGTVPLYIKEALPEEVDIFAVIAAIEERLPHHVFSNVEMILIGYFKEFEERSINAFYEDGAIYVTNRQDDNEDLIDDIVHETAHAFEKGNEVEIYGDRKIEHEFLSKRAILYRVLEDQDMIPDYMTEEDFLYTEYTEDFDAYLHDEVGYDALNILASELFVSAYSITSIKEYFAEGFEEYFIRGDRYLKLISPQLYTKLINTIEGNK